MTGGVEILLVTGQRWKESLVNGALRATNYRLVLTRLVGDPLRALDDNPDLALACVDLAASDTVTLSDITSNRRGVPTIVLGDDHEPIRVVSALREGAKSYVSTSEVEFALARSVKAALAGVTWLSPMTCEAIRTWLIGLPYLPTCNTVREELLLLSRRERRVVELLGHGYSYARVASTMRITLDTVRTHVKSAYRKLGVSRRFELLRIVEGESILAPEPQISDPLEATDIAVR